MEECIHIDALRQEDAVGDDVGQRLDPIRADDGHGRGDDGEERRQGPNDA